jgi:hypothetical protein
MDPLSLAAGLIAVIQLASKVTTTCLDLSASIRAFKELDRVFNEVDALRDVLQKLVRLHVKLQNSQSASENLISSSRPISICRVELEGLLEELDKIKTSNSKITGKTISWIFKEKEIEGRLERLANAKQTLQLSLSVDQT